METKTLEKKLLYFDQAEYKRQLGDFQGNLDLLNQIAERYEAIFSGKLIQERLTQIFVGSFQPLREAAILATSKSAKNQMLAEVLIERAGERLDEFENEASKLVNRFNKTGERQVFATVTPLEWYSINSEGRFFIPDATLAEIRDRCSNYIENEQQQHIYDLLEKLAQLNNEIYDSFGKRAKAEIDLSSDHRHRVISDLLTSDSAGNTVVDPQNNYKFLAQ